ncbi:MAG: hypothetical protein WCY19_07840 [Candidatus Gastranaerophilaceae bacterium]
MKLFEKKTTVKIAEDDLKDAKLSSIGFADESTKKRAFIDVLGARLAMKLLFSQKIEANNLYSLYTIHNVLEDFDLADIYYQGIKMDVRLVFNKDEIFIPKTHFDYELLPDIYIVLCLKEDLSSAEILGFFEPKNLDKSNSNKDFYFYDPENLNKPEELKKFLDNFAAETDFDISENAIENAEELFLSLVDKEIPQNEKLLLFKQLANDFSLREKLVEFENFEILSKEVAKDDEMLQDGVLDIIGTQKLFEDDNDNDEEGIGNGGQETEFSSQNNSSIEQNTEGGLVEGGLNVVAAGLGLGGAIVAGTAAAAVAESGLAQSAAEVLSSGIDAGSEIIGEGIKNITTQDEEFDFEVQDEELTGEEFDFEVQDEEPEIEASEENLQDVELPEIEIQAETLPEEELPEIEAKEETLPEEKLSELENMPNLEAFEDDFAIDEEEKAEKKEEVFNLEDFDFDMLSEDGEKSEAKQEKHLVSLDAITNEGEENQLEESEALRKFRELEESEDEANGTIAESTQNKDESDEFISQVDEFLNDVNLSEEQKNLLGSSLAIEEEPEETPIEAAIEQPEITPETEKLEEDQDLLKVLFKEGQPDVVPAIDFEGKNTPEPLYKNKKMVIAASIAGVVLASFVIGGSILGNKKNDDNLLKDPNAAPISADSQSSTGNSQDENMQGMDQMASQSQQQAIPGEGQQAGSANRDMGKAISDAFSSEPVNASISKVAWEVPEDLAYNDSFRKYLQIAGKNLKLNLQNNLLLATEMAYSNKVIVDLGINGDGSLLSSNVAVSSGSKQIDKIVLQSVKETLKYLKMPSSELGGRSTNATLIINF